MSLNLYSRKNPYMAKIQKRYRLNSPLSSKDVYHLTLDLRGSGIEYSPGDALGVIPFNDFETIERVLSHFKFKDEKEREEAKEILKHKDIRVSYGLAEEFQSITENSDNGDNIDIMEILKRARGKIDFENFISLLRPITPRLYSIASSPIDKPEEIDLTIAVEKYTIGGKEYGGLCTNFLLDGKIKIGDKVPIFLHKNSSFRLPEKSCDIIMVGPGTGIAPFRSFIKERQLTKDCGRNWLFFGSRTRDHDFYYKEELLQWEEEGHLQLDTAFSREGKEKFHVQDRMMEKSYEIWKWIENGSYIYICGDASRMAKAVDNALKIILVDEGSMTLEEADFFMRSLKKEGRYCRDVY